jgi:hypothetical protein
MYDAAATFLVRESEGFFHVKKLDELPPPTASDAEALEVSKMAATLAAVSGVVSLGAVIDSCLTLGAIARCDQLPSEISSQYTDAELIEMKR